MKKVLTAVCLAVMCLGATAGEIGLPKERLALPNVSGEHLVCVWDSSAGSWMQGFESYDHSGVYEFQVPEWGKWYWVGLWDKASGSYIFGKWIGHFPSE